MSDDQATKSPAVDATAVDSAAAAPRKPLSSRVGRIIIGVLLLILAVEGAAAIRVHFDKHKLTSELAKAEASDHIVTRAAVQTILGRQPDESKRIKAAVGEELYDIYYFTGLLKQRVLCVRYGVEGTTDADESQREMMEVLTVVPEVVLFEEASQQ